MRIESLHHMCPVPVRGSVESRVREAAARRGTEPGQDRSRTGDSVSVIIRIEGQGPRAPLTSDGEETEKQERRQVGSGWVRMAAPPPHCGARGSRRAGARTRSRLATSSRDTGPGPSEAARVQDPRAGRARGPRRQAGPPRRGTVPPLPFTGSGKRSSRPEEPGGRLRVSGRARGDRAAFPGRGRSGLRGPGGVEVPALLLSRVGKFLFLPLYL